MVYSNKVVAAIKVNGQVLRESGSLVAIPFGSEYSIYLKNLHGVRAQFRVSVDGTDATSGMWLIAEPNGAIDLERFIVNGDLSQGRRFKFIERSAAVEAHRGVKAEDGLVRVEYQIEMVQPRIPTPIPDYYPVPTPYPDPWYPRPWPRQRRCNDGLDWTPYGLRSHSSALGSASRSLGASGGGQSAQNVNQASQTLSQTCDFMSYNSASNPTASAEPGITVAGSLSQQQFHMVSGFQTTGITETVVLQLRGAIGKQKVTKAITVKTKLTCSSCGKSHKSGIEFCSGCGTALVA